MKILGRGIIAYFKNLQDFNNYGNASGGSAFYGWLDEVRLTDAVLTSDQFLIATAPTPAALPAGLALLGAMAIRRRR